MDQARTDKELDGVASVEKFAMEEGTEPFTRVEHTRYDGGERDSEKLTLPAVFSTSRCLYAANEL